MAHFFGPIKFMETLRADENIYKSFLNRKSIGRKKLSLIAFCSSSVSLKHLNYLLEFFGLTFNFDLASEACVFEGVFEYSPPFSRHGNEWLWGS